MIFKQGQAVKFYQLTQWENKIIERFRISNDFMIDKQHSNFRFLRKYVCMYIAYNFKPNFSWFLFLIFWFVFFYNLLRHCLNANPGLRRQFLNFRLRWIEFFPCGRQLHSHRNGNLRFGQSIIITATSSGIKNIRRTAHCVFGARSVFNGSRTGLSNIINVTPIFRQITENMFGC